MSGNFRIGLVGCGRWGRNILRDLQLLDCVVEIADPDINSCNAARNQGAVAAVSSVDRWRLSQFDGFIIAAPIPDHGRLIDQLLSAGKPIYCEKPLTCDVAAAREIALHAADRVFVMHKWRYHPGIEAMAEMARLETYGRVKEIVTRRLQWTAPADMADAIWSLAPHDLSIVYGILQCLPEPVAATGQSDHHGRPRSLFGLLRDAGGPGVNIHVAANWPQTERVVCVSFEHATVIMRDPLADHLDVFPVRNNVLGNKERLTISTESPLMRELRAFTAHLGGGPCPGTSAHEGALIVETIDRLRTFAGFAGR